MVGKGCSDPQVDFSSAPWRKASAGQTSPFCFFGGFSSSMPAHCKTQGGCRLLGQTQPPCVHVPHGDTDHRGCEGDKDPITTLVPSTIFE